MSDPRESADLNFIGPPVGWFGDERKIFAHPSLLGRYVNQTMYGDGLVQIHGIGERFNVT